MDGKGIKTYKGNAYCIEDWLLVQNFYSGLLSSTRSIVASAAVGDLMEYTVNGALKLLERVAYHNFE